ncbi:MAG: hypothetical protein M0Q92_13860 [Methanoregula sp.]|jgi:hypothetical protein|nr:hypothetical protein [Methanoregula sp.]
MLDVFIIMYEQDFPNLNQEGFQVTSAINVSYNCIAWAAGDNNKWWWPDNFKICYWPEDIPRQDSVDAFIKMFGKFGYSPCENRELEDGYEKIAIYANDTAVTHASRQLPTGKWTSKLGQSHDIEHTLIGLNSKKYGMVQQILKRKIK